MATPQTDDFAAWEKGKKGAKAKAAKGPARDFRIERVDNGFVSYANHDVNPKIQKMPGAYIGDSMTSRKVHPSIEDAASHLIALFGSGGGKTPVEPKQPTTPQKADSDAKKDAASKK